MAETPLWVKQYRDLQAELSREREARKRAEAERDQWKSNHDGQVATKRRLSAQYSRLHEAALVSLTAPSEDADQALMEVLID